MVSPLERLKILMQVQSVGRDAYKMSVGQALAKMWREEGWRGFMRGNGTNCIRIVPYSAVQFSSYNFYKRVCRQRALILKASSLTSRTSTYSRRRRVLTWLPLRAYFAVELLALRLYFLHIPLTLSELVCRSNQQASPSWVTAHSSCLACGQQ